METNTNKIMIIPIIILLILGILACVFYVKEDKKPSKKDSKTTINSKESTTINSKNKSILGYKTSMQSICGDASCDKELGVLVLGDKEYNVTVHYSYNIEDEIMNKDSYIMLNDIKIDLIGNYNVYLHRFNDNMLAVAGSYAGDNNHMDIYNEDLTKVYSVEDAGDEIKLTSDTIKYQRHEYAVADDCTEGDCEDLPKECVTITIKDNNFDKKVEKEKK